MIWCAYVQPCVFLRSLVNSNFEYQWISKFLHINTSILFIVRTITVYIIYTYICNILVYMCVCVYEKLMLAIVSCYSLPLEYMIIAIIVMNRQCANVWHLLAAESSFWFYCYEHPMNFHILYMSMSMSISECEYYILHNVDQQRE